MRNMMEEKKIVAFACENSAGLAAENAGGGDGIGGLVEVVHLPCSGKVEVRLVLQALERGHPGVLILGCPRDNCKFLKGNLRAQKRVQSIRALLRAIGIEEERVQMDYLSSVDAHRLVEIVRRMRERLDGLPAAGRPGSEGGLP